MPFADHVFNKSDAGITAVQDNSNPFLSGALRMDNEGNEFTPASNFVNEHLGGSFAIGHTKGFIRTQMTISTHLLQVTREGEYGIYFMASQLDITSTGSAYAFVLHVSTTFDWRLVEYSSGIGITGATVLESGSTFGDPGLGTQHAIEVDWEYDPVTIGGILIICRVSPDKNFANMQDVYTRTISSPLTTSLAEGLMFADLEGSNAFDLKRVYFDNTFYSNFTTSVLS